MPLLPNNGDDDVIAVESHPFNIEASGVSIEEKVDGLIHTAVSVKAALDRRTMLIVWAVIIPLVVGVVMVWRQNIITTDSRKVANLAYVQSLINSRDFLQYRRDFAQTRDCPINYFKALLDASRSNGDLTVIAPPCEPVDLPEIDAKIAALEEKIALAQKR